MVALCVWVTINFLTKLHLCFESCWVSLCPLSRWLLIFCQLKIPFVSLIGLTSERRKAFRRVFSVSFFEISFEIIDRSDGYSLCLYPGDCSSDGWLQRKKTTTALRELWVSFLNLLKFLNQLVYLMVSLCPGDCWFSDKAPSVSPCLARGLVRVMWLRCENNKPRLRHGAWEEGGAWAKPEVTLCRPEPGFSQHRSRSTRVVFQYFLLNYVLWEVIINNIAIMRAEACSWW